MILIKLTLLQNLQTFKQTFTLNQRAVINNFYLLHWNKGTAYTIQALRLNCLCSWKSWRNREILARSLENIDSTKTFKLSILDFVRPGENSVFAVHDINGLQLLTRLRLNLVTWMNVNFDITLMIQSIQCVRAVKNPKQLSTTSCAAIFIPYVD